MQLTFCSPIIRLSAADNISRSSLTFVVCLRQMKIHRSRQFSRIQVCSWSLTKFLVSKASQVTSFTWSWSVSGSLTILHAAQATKWITYWVTAPKTVSQKARLCAKFQLNLSEFRTISSRTKWLLFWSSICWQTWLWLMASAERWYWIRLKSHSSCSTW